MGNLPDITSGAIRLQQNSEYAGDIPRKLSINHRDIQSSIFQESKKKNGAGSGRNRRGEGWTGKFDIG
jgi:hypothetical protein